MLAEHVKHLAALFDAPGLKVSKKGLRRNARLITLIAAEMTRRSMELARLAD